MKIIDFGLAIRVNDPMFKNFKCGTVGYVAPEVLSSEILTKNIEKIDMFSIGAIMYKM